jgi:hypothetical protein
MSTKPPTFVDQIWTYGNILSQLPAFLGAVNAEPEVSTESMADQIISRGMMGVMAVAVSMAAPFVFAGGVAVKAGEKLWAKIDILPEVAACVQAFGEALAEQRQLLEQQFQPLLAMRDRAALIAKQTEKKAEEVEAGAKTLQQLREEYQAEAPLLDQIEAAVARIESAAVSDPKGLKETLFQERISLLKQISDEERMVRELTARLKGVMGRVLEKASQLEKLEEETTLLTRIKGMQIEVLQTALPSELSKLSTQVPSHVIVESMV